MREEIKFLSERILRTAVFNYIDPKPKDHTNGDIQADYYKAIHSVKEHLIMKCQIQGREMQWMLDALYAYPSELQRRLDIIYRAREDYIRLSALLQAEKFKEATK